MATKRQTGSGSRRNQVLVALAYIAIGVIATVLLVSSKLALEKTTLGRQNEMWIYGMLQDRLSSLDTENPVVLLDISGISDEKLLDKLTEMIKALVALQHRPLAIGVDVDFSPPPNGDIDDDELLQFCHNSAVPIFLAVARNKSALPKAWLGDDRYKDLAAAVAINPDDTRKVPLWVRREDRPEALKTLSYSLALKYEKHPIEPPHWIGWAVERQEEQVSRPQRDDNLPENARILVYGYRQVNYSKLLAMKNAAKTDNNAEAIKTTGDVYDAYENKIVLIGDVSRPRDVFPIPGRAQNEAGSLLLASATYALIKEPVFEFKPKVRLLLDFMIAGFIILMVAVVRYRNPDELFWLGKQALFIYVAIGSVIILGWLMMIAAGVMWLDFFLVAFALFLHPKVERLIHAAGSRLYSKLASWSGKPTAAGTAALILCAWSLTYVGTVQGQKASPSCREGSAAVILSLKLDPKDKRRKKTCYLRKDRTAKEAKPLSPSDEDTQLIAGEDLYCDEGCVLILKSCGSGDTFEMGKNLPKSYTVKETAPLGRVLDENPGIPARTFAPQNPGPEPDELTALIKNNQFQQLFAVEQTAMKLSGQLDELAAVSNAVRGGAKASEAVSGSSSSGVANRSSSAANPTPSTQSPNDKIKVSEAVLYSKGGLSGRPPTATTEAASNRNARLNSAARATPSTQSPSKRGMEASRGVLPASARGTKTQEATTGAATADATIQPNSAASATRSIQSPGKQGMEPNRGVLPSSAGGTESQEATNASATPGATVRQNSAAAATPSTQSPGKQGREPNRGVLPASAGGTETQEATNSSATSSAASRANSAPETTPSPDLSALENMTRDLYGFHGDAEKRDPEAEFLRSLMLGNSLRDAKEFVQAEQSYRSGAVLNPNDSRSFYGLGNVYADQAKWDEAVKAYQQAISLAPTRSEPYVALAASLIENTVPENSAERLSQAESLLRTAARLNPGDEKIYDLRDVVLARRAASPAETETAYREMLNLNQRSVGTNLRLSKLLWRSGRQSESKVYLMVAEAAASTSADLLKVAEVLESRREYDRAEQVVRRVLKTSPSNQHAQLLFGLLMIDRKHFQTAILKLRVVTASAPNDFAPYYLLGIAYLGERRLAQAELTFVDAAARLPHDKSKLVALAYWLAVLGDTYSSSGHTADAIRVFEKVLTFVPDDMETTNKLAALRSRQKH